MPSGLKGGGLAWYLGNRAGEFSDAMTYFVKSSLSGGISAAFRVLFLPKLFLLFWRIMEFLRVGLFFD